MLPPLPETALCEALRHKVLGFLNAEGVLAGDLAERMPSWHHSGFSVHNRIRSKATDAEGRQRLARYMTRCPFALEKMSYDPGSGMVVYRSRLHATLKRNYQLIPGLKWLWLLMNHIPDKYEDLVRYYGYYSKRSRGIRRLAQQDADIKEVICIDDTPIDTRRKANWARLIQKVYEVDPLECLHCGGTLRIPSSTIPMSLRDFQASQPVGPNTGGARLQRARPAASPKRDLAADLSPGASCRLRRDPQGRVRPDDDQIARIRQNFPPGTPGNRHATPAHRNSRKLRSNARQERHYSYFLYSASREMSIEFPILQAGPASSKTRRDARIASAARTGTSYSTCSCAAHRRQAAYRSRFG